MKQINGHRLRRNGQALVEFALILPILLFFILGVIDYGRIVFVYANMSNAVREAARHATLQLDDAYADCEQIIQPLDNTLFATLDSVQVLYYQTDGARWTDYPNTADFSCEDDSDGDDDNIPMIQPDSVENGDILRVVVDARLNFITPIISSLYPSLRLRFETQRTIIVSIQVPETTIQCDAPDDFANRDEDMDGLCDWWEYTWFGCALDDAQECMTVTINGTEYDAPALNAYSAADDPDDDNCDNACEQEYDLCPIDTDACTGADSDGDGLSDGEEILNYFTLPHDDDSDDDTLRDGEEIDPNRFGVHPYGATDPNNPDSDGDGLSDGEEVRVYNSNPNTSDSDDDGLADAVEVNLNNTTYDYQINNTLVTDVLLVVDLTANDSDGDGLPDGCEIDPQGDTCSIENPFVVAAPATAFTYSDKPDSDNDGLSDGFEVRLVNNLADRRIAEGNHIFFPRLADADEDGVVDGLEYEHYANPNSPNSDADCCEAPNEARTFTRIDGVRITLARCELSDYDEIILHGSNPSALDINDDGQADGFDSDSDGIPDCVEILAYTTHPNNADSDGDGLEDAVDPAPLIAQDDYDATDSDEDYLPDDWERMYFGSLDVSSNTDDPDGDGWDNLHEFQNQTDPTRVDTDGDSLWDSQEPSLGTDPTQRDTDDDFLSDDCELFPTDALRVNVTLAHGVSLQVPSSDVPLCDYPNYAPTIPTDADTDDDGLLDGQELRPIEAIGSDLELDNYQAAYGTMNPHDADSDSDGLTDAQEAMPAALGLHSYGASNPNSTNTDGDGWSDYDEVMTFLANPNASDTDGDGLDDDLEERIGTYWSPRDYPNVGMINADDPRLTDYDRDSLSDSLEYYGITIDIIVCDDVDNPVTRQVLGWSAEGDNRLDPLNPDSDGDNTQPNIIDMRDGAELTANRRLNGNAIAITDPTKRDSDDDDADFDLPDGLALSDTEELIANTDDNPNNDTAGVHCADVDDAADSDRDGLTNAQEDSGLLNNYANRSTDKFLSDTDADFDDDGDEVLGATLDTQYIDRHGTPQAITVKVNTDPNIADTDGDGIPDGVERRGYYDDADLQAIFGDYFDWFGKGVSDGPHTHPLIADTDGDGIPDGWEIRFGRDPLDASSDVDYLDRVLGADTPLREMIAIYWDLEANTDDSTRMTNALTVARNQGVIVEDNHFVVRLTEKPTRVGQMTHYLQTSDIPIVSDDADSIVVDVRVDMPSLAELVLQRAIETIALP